MPSPTYDRLFNLVESYLGRAKAETALSGQLARCNATRETLSQKDVSKILNYIRGATKIHLAGNEAQQQKLDAELLAFAGNDGLRPGLQR